ncbi:hypothetical protein GGX14DRAFT_387209 [Mycena pura]|uniref:Uncharacterized protein n=1 Tax=Mycena pura TaxID=153505 RepID=A0AAD6YNN8_9AGAR|nr:hypothetical protein GGX14DRAFT_387209 [Mycena pura]
MPKTQGALCSWISPAAQALQQQAAAHAQLAAQTAAAEEAAAADIEMHMMSRHVPRVPSLYVPADSQTDAGSPHGRSGAEQGMRLHACNFLDDEDSEVMPSGSAGDVDIWTAAGPRQPKGIIQHIEARSLLGDVTEWEPNDRVCANFMPNKLHVKPTAVVDGSALGGAAHSVLVEYRVFPAQHHTHPLSDRRSSVFLCEALLCNRIAHGDTASSAAGAEFRSAALPSGRWLSTSSSMNCRRRYHGFVQCAEREPHPEGTQYTHGGTRPNGRTRTLASSVLSTGPSAANGVFFPVCFGRAAILMAPPKIVGVVETPDVVVGAVDPKRHVVTARGADQRRWPKNECDWECNSGTAYWDACGHRPGGDTARGCVGRNHAAAVWRHAGPEERFPAEVRHTGEEPDVDGAVARGLKECGVEDANYGIICAIFRLCVRIAFLVRELSTRDTLAEDVCSGVRADARVNFGAPAARNSSDKSQSTLLYMLQEPQLRVFEVLSVMIAQMNHLTWPSSAETATLTGGSTVGVVPKITPGGVFACNLEIPMSAADHFRPTDHGRHDHIAADRPQTICPHGSHVNQITEPKGDFGCVSSSRALRSHNITGTGCGPNSLLTMQAPHPGTAVDGPATTVNGPTAVMPAADIVAPVPSVEVMDSTDSHSISRLSARRAQGGVLVFSY